MKTVTDLVTEFHKAYGCEIGNDHFEFPEGDELASLRSRLIKEEYKEVKEAMADGDSEETLKELCDLMYVAVGTAVAFGWDFDGAFAEVHRSNLSKLGEDGKPVRREDGKILKGPNYSPADMREFI